MANNHREPSQEGAQRQGISRDRVLEISLELFSTSGYRETSLEDVARTLKVTRQAIYHYFARKEDILVGVFDQLLDELDRATNDVMAADLDDGQRLGELVRAHLEVVSTHPDHMSVALAERSNLSPTAQRRIGRRRLQHQDRLVTAFEQAVAGGYCRPIDPDFGASMVILAANSVPRWVGRTRSDSSDVVRLVQQFLTGGYLSAS